VAPRIKDPKLITRVITFELPQHTPTIPQRHRDGRTDGRMTYDSNTALALRASRGNKRASDSGNGVCRTYRHYLITFIFTIFKTG